MPTPARHPIKRGSASFPKARTNRSASTGEALLFPAGSAAPGAVVGLKASAAGEALCSNWAEEEASDSGAASEALPFWDYLCRMGRGGEALRFDWPTGSASLWAQGENGRREIQAPGRRSASFRTGGRRRTFSFFRREALRHWKTFGKEALRLLCFSLGSSGKATAGESGAES